MTEYGPNHADEADWAWQLYTERGVIPLGFAGEIAERRKLLREWAESDDPNGDGGALR